MYFIKMKMQMVKQNQSLVHDVTSESDSCPKRTVLHQNFDFDSDYVQNFYGQNFSMSGGLDTTAYVSALCR